MFMSADTMAYLVSLGLSGEQMVELVQRIAADAEAVSGPRKSNAERQARFRARKAEQEASVTNNVTCNATDNVTTPCPPSFPPRPPQTPTHTPGYILPARGVALAKPNGFARFWEAYPRKIGKGAAEKAYRAACAKIGGPDPPGVLLAALERVKATWREPEFIPHPSTWLNQSRWEDEPETQIAEGQNANRAPALQPKTVARLENYRRAFAGAQVAADSG
jgi:hypothetical protein